MIILCQMLMQSAGAQSRVPFMEQRKNEGYWDWFGYSS